MSEKLIDVSGEKPPPEEKPKAKNHAGIKDRPQNASRIYTRVDRAERAWEKDIRERCERTLDRLVEVFEGREDWELATVLREDGAAMIGGMIAMCGSAEWLRKPVTGAMAVTEPIVAFGRLLRVLFGRFQAARISAAEERAWAEQEAERQAAEAAQQFANDAAQQEQSPYNRHNRIE